MADLYRRYSGDVRRFVTFLSGDPAEAEDVTAETFLRVWSTRSELRMPTVRSYLFTIARHLYLDRRRGRPETSNVEDRFADPAPLPDTVALKRRELKAVMAAVRRLPEVDRAALLMRGVEGMSYEEIAASLGLGVSAAKVKVHRARRRLSAACRGGEEES